MALDSIPQARVVRKGGRLLAPPPPPRRPGPDPVEVVLSYVLGLWPLTCVVLLALGLLILAGHNGAP